MKKFLTLAAIVLVTSCTKNSEQLQQDNTPVANPTVTSYSFGRVTSGTNESVRFNVTLSGTEKAKAFKIYRMPSENVATVNLPENKSYTLYDHIIGDYPTYSANVWYYFVWEMKNGETILLNKFQVY